MGEYWTINNNEDFSYCQDEKLGEGRAGTCVFLGKFKQHEVRDKDADKVAVKRIQLAGLNALNKELVQREIDNLRQLQHEHIVKYLKYEDDQYFRYIAFELCDTDLKKYVSSPEYDRMLNKESNQIEILLQLTEALDFIHSRKIIHRDIKPANVLVSFNKCSVIMKWADFGHSKQTNDNGCALMSGPRGTGNWLAPEIIPLFYRPTVEKSSEARSSIKSDIFSAGCVFFFFLTKGVHPYSDNEWEREKNMLDGKMKNENRLNKDHRAKPTVLQMMEDRLGLETVISEFEEVLWTPREPSREPLHFQNDH